MSEKYSVNEAKEVLTTNQDEGGRTPSIHLEEIDAYKYYVNEMRTKLIELVQEQSMAEGVAERIINEFMYDAFKQIVKIRID